MSVGYYVKTPIGMESTTSNGGLMDSAWPMFSHDVRHSGRSLYGKSGNWWREKWKINIGSMVYSSPAISNDGTIYIGSNNWYFFAINPDGTEKWHYKTEESIHSSPALAVDGTIYVGSDDGYLYAIYPNGTKNWRLQIGVGSIYSSPVIDEEGNIYVASVRGNNICAVYPNGTKKWDFHTGNRIYSSPALDNETVYCGSHDGFFYAIYKNNGTLKWKFNTGNWCGGDGAAIGNDGAIYFGHVEGYFYALHSNGTLKWRLKLGVNVVSSPAIAEDGTIYVAAYQDLDSANIYSINPDGTINWKYVYLTEYISTSPAIDKYGIIYFGTWDGYLLALNPDGTLRWSFKALDEIFSSPAIGEDGTIYFGSDSKDFTAILYAIEPVEGNSPPEKPSIDGPTQVKLFKEYTYTVVTSDPDGDKVSYYVDWGDDTNSGWTELSPSGVPITLKHRRRYVGINWAFVKVQARDEYGAWSDWTTLQVNIRPRTRATVAPYWLRFIDMFPILQRLLGFIR